MESYNFSKDHFFPLGELLEEERPGYLHLLFTGSAEAVGSGKNFVPPLVHREFAGEIARRIGLSFIPEREDDGNLCLADSSEVMPEFRETCTRADLRNYVYGLLDSSENLEKLKKPAEIYSIQVPYSQDVLAFWKQVNVGRQLVIAFYRKKWLFSQRKILDFQIISDFQ